MKLTVTQMTRPAIQVLTAKWVARRYRRLRRWPGEARKALWIRRRRLDVAAQGAAAVAGGRPAGYSPASRSARAWSAGSSL